MAAMQQQDTWKYAPYLYGLLGVIAAIFLYVIYKNNAILAGASGSKLFLALTVAIPEILIWVIALRGAVRFKIYTNGISKDKDGSGLSYVANSLLWMVGYIVLLIISGTFIRYFAQSDNFHNAVILANHLPLIFMLISAILLYAGARKLNRVVQFKVSSEHTSLFWIAGVVLGLLFVVNFARSAERLVLPNDIPRFVMSAETLIFTYAVPHIIVWSLGFYAMLSLLNYSLHVKGEIYKRFFRQLFWGLIVVYVSTFLAQMLILAGVRLDYVNPLLFFTYGLLLLGIYGFVLIYRGAKNLQRIERI